MSEKMEKITGTIILIVLSVAMLLAMNQLGMDLGL